MPVEPTRPSRRHPRRRIPPVWVWPLLAVLALAFLTAVSSAVILTMHLIRGAADERGALVSPPIQDSGTSAKRKTFSRDEIREIWNWTRTEDGIKQKFGPPDKTTEEFHDWHITGGNGGGGTDRITVYHYYKLSVDANGSGKVDSEVVMKFIASADSLQFIP